VIIIITIVCAEGGSSIEHLKKSIEQLGEKAEVIYLANEMLQIDTNYYLDSDIIHSRCGIGEYNNKLTLYSWQFLNLLDGENKYRFVNSLKSMYNSSDKFKTAKLLNKKNIKTPKTGLIRDYNDGLLFMKKNNLSYPIIIKKCFSKCGVSVKLVNNNEELKNCTKEAIWNGTIIQEYIDFKDNNTYKDIRILVVNGEVVGGYKRVSSNFITNLHQGNTVEFLNLNNELKEIALKSADAINGEIVGVDILKNNKNNEYYVLETNTSPGTKGFRELGIDVDKIIAKYLVDCKKR